MPSYEYNKKSKYILSNSLKGLYLCNIFINECYCKYVSKQQNEELYKEISDLLGLYAYTKNKTILYS
jgi:hypothetical protein